MKVSYKEPKCDGKEPHLKILLDDPWVTVPTSDWQVCYAGRSITALTKEPLMKHSSGRRNWMKL